MIGRRFSKLVVVERAGFKGTAWAWLCLCDCGNTRIIAGTQLRFGLWKSCGCASPRFKSERIKTPGMVGTPTYQSWQGMLHRCSDKSKGKSRRLYFEKGIRVCEKWQTFEGFIADMGERPPETSIERIDGTKGYCKENCCWATAKEQANNTSRNRRITFNGKTQTITEWAAENGVKVNTIVYRLRRGWNGERAIQKDAVSLRVENILAREKACEICGKLFVPRLAQLRDGHGKYCSQKCNGQSRITSAGK